MGDVSTFCVVQPKVPNFKPGQWVRHKPSGELRKLLGEGYGFWNTNHPIYANDQLLTREIEPALPRYGEAWMRNFCPIHGHASDDVRKFKAPCDWRPDCDRASEIPCGCLVPVNFGRGEEVTS